MSEPFLSEIKIMSFNFPPKGWTFCNGQLLPINQNQALFSLLGTTYGGNGQTTFGLPDLRGRVPIHFGSGHVLGEAAGSTAVTLNTSQLAAHNHLIQADSAASTTNTPTNNTVLGRSAGVINPPGSFNVSMYNTANPGAALNPAAVTNVGGGQPHNNMQPFLVLNFCIALQGIFPSQN
jgi:microcystin-dependent protein